MAGSSYFDARQPDAVQAAAIASRQQSPLAQFAAAGSAAPSPQMLADLLRGGQQAVTNATRMGPTTSGTAVGLNALAGYLGGRQQAQAYDAMPTPAAPTGQGGIGSDAVAAAQASDQSGLSGLQQVLGRKSNRRLKSEVTRVGTLPNGLPLYRYRLEGGPFELGCMADEVAAVCPDATWLDPDDGYARVDYSRLLG